MFRNEAEPHLLKAAATTRLPGLMYSVTARIRASYEYMNYLSVIQDFIRTPCGAGLRGNQHHEQTLSDQSYALLQEVMVSDS